MQQILNNLISNALKFTDYGFIEFGCTIENSDTIQFYVKDTGIGIPSEKQRIIFERFRQGENLNISRKFGGAGLGLSICKGLLDLMKGRIWLESIENEGTTFFFSIPFMPILTEKITEECILDKNFDWSNKLIMIVEDDVFSSKLLVKAISKTNARYILAKDSKTAIELFKDNPGIDLVLMDIQLPDISGYEVTRILKNINPSVYIIAQTAFAFEEDKINCLAAGCCDFLAKPLDKNVLLNTIDKYLTKH